MTADVAELVRSLGVGTLDPARASCRLAREASPASACGSGSLLELGVTDAAVLVLHIRWGDEES